jgi:anaerobic sulfite reductase subunit B
MNGVSPVQTTVPLRYRVAAVRRETHDTHTLRLMPVGQPIDRFRAGQFATAHVLGVGEAAVPISGNPLSRDRTLTCTVRSVGKVSQALCEARTGQEIGVSGPFGTSWDVCDAVGGDLLFVASGSGLAPLRSALLEALTVRGCFGRISVVLSARAPGELLFTDQYEDWRAQGALVLVTVDRVPIDPCTLTAPAWTGRVGLVTEAVADLPLRPERTTAFLSGAQAMTNPTGDTLRTLGVPPEKIRFLITETGERQGSVIRGGALADLPARTAVTGRVGHSALARQG